MQPVERRRHPDSRRPHSRQHRRRAPEPQDGVQGERPEDIPGGKCDILASTEATLLGPITSSFITYTVGGHAALSTSSYIDDKFMLSDDEIIEATGMNDGDNPTVVSNKLYWINDRVYKSMMVLRTNITEEQKDEVLSYCSSFIDDPYNFSFLFNTKNQVYCSDIISRSFLKVACVRY